MYFFNRLKMKEKYQIKKWIENVIKSCNTWDQVSSCERLINNFEIQLVKEDYDKMLATPYIFDLKYKIDLQKRKLIENNTLIKN